VADFLNAVCSLKIRIDSRSTSPTFDPKKNGRLPLCGTIADWVALPLTPCQQESRGFPMQREARLRPEYAHFYPMLEPGKWEPAASVAEKIVATRLLQLADTFVWHDRVLAEAHFEFRGGSARRDTSQDGRARTQPALSRDEVQNPSARSYGLTFSSGRGAGSGEKKKVTRVREKNSR
jgi:hypothetical protein